MEPISTLVVLARLDIRSFICWPAGASAARSLSLSSRSCWAARNQLRQFPFAYRGRIHFLCAAADAKAYARRERR